MEEVLDKGPFFHGTKAKLATGEFLEPKHESNFEEKRISNYIYFTGTLDAAKWGAELALGADLKERIYLVEPLSEFENDPNLTDKKFPGNPTRSYRTMGRLKIVGELASWERHSEESINTMLTNLESLRNSGLAKIDD